jgi:hypothetical protein
VIRVEEGYPEQSLLKLATDTDVRALNFWNRPVSALSTTTEKLVLVCWATCVTSQRPLSFNNYALTLTLQRQPSEANLFSTVTTRNLTPCPLWKAKVLPVYKLWLHKDNTAQTLARNDLHNSLRSR